MTHVVFGEGAEPSQEQSPVASTSKVTLEQDGTGSPVPVFKKRKDKKRALSLTGNENGGSETSIVNGKQAAGANGVSSISNKRVKTFYNDEDDDDEEADEEEAAGSNTRKPNGIASNGSGVESKKQARKKLQAEKKDRAAHLLNARMTLPVWHAQEAILKEIEARDTVVVLGETGSGKTTQIPQFLLSSKICRPQPRIAVTQPRRVAATSLARRVSEEVGCDLGGTVGYTVRFDDCSSPRTRLKYLTDGTLLQEILGDRLLEIYDVVIIDEAHERTLRTDMILGFLKGIQKTRKEMARTGEKSAKSGNQVGPLKIVVMSATLDAKRFSDFYDGAKVLYIKGRSHKVIVRYLDSPVTDYIEASVKTIFQIHYNLPPGDILVFLAGQDDIEGVKSQIELYLPSLDPKKQQILVCPLYARLTSAEQNKAFNVAPPNTRKVILATNVAETSITISGIKYVIDAGMAKEKTYHAASGMDSLLLQPIGKSSATQRAGRAGRESSGTCFRLYTELNYHELRQAVPPEIQRCSLSFALLHLLAYGQEDVRKFEYMDRPADEAITAALIELYGLGAVGEDGKISSVGRKMASLPLEPRQAKILLSSFSHNCPREIIDLLSLLGSADQLLTVPHAQRETAASVREKFIHRTGDHMMLLNILHSYEEICESMPSARERRAWCKDHFFSQKTLNSVLEGRKQLRDRVDKLGLDWKTVKNEEGTDDSVLRCLMSGLFTNTAMRMPDGSYRRTMGTMKIKIHPSSILQGKRVDAIVFSELIYTSSIYARICSSVPLLWLREMNPMVAHKPASSASVPKALKPKSEDETA